MASVELTSDQVLSLFRQLPVPTKRATLAALVEEADRSLDQVQHEASTAMRRLAADRRLDWDSLDDEQREALVNGLIHEVRRAR